jgi:hypothetical protein
MQIQIFTVPFREANMALAVLPQVFPKDLFESAPGYFHFFIAQLSARPHRLKSLFHNLYIPEFFNSGYGH